MVSRRNSRFDRTVIAALYAEYTARFPGMK